MKKFLLYSVLSLISVVCFSQDLIIKKNGEEIKAKVSEVNQSEIKYKKIANLTGPVYTISKSEVIMIRYEDGTNDIFNDDHAKNNNETNKIDMVLKGKEDANLYYKGKKSGAGGTAVTTILISPLIGLIPAVACASSEPDDKNLNYKEKELMRNSDYNRAYTDQAHKIKKKKVWTAFGIASAVWFVLILVLGSGG